MKLQKEELLKTLYLRTEKNDRKAFFEIYKLTLHDDPENAIKNLEHSASLGYVPAKYDLAISFLYGDMVSKNVPEAVRLFKECAEQGHERSISKLAYMYITGYEVKRDKQKADTYKKMKKGQYKKNNEYGNVYEYGSENIKSDVILESDAGIEQQMDISEEQIYLNEEDIKLLSELKGETKIILIYDDENYRYQIFDAQDASPLGYTENDFMYRISCMKEMKKIEKEPSYIVGLQLKMTEDGLLVSGDIRPEYNDDM